MLGPRVAVLVPLLMISCGTEEPPAEGAVAQTPADGDDAAAEDPGPEGGGPDRDAPIQARLEGTLVYEAYEGGTIQVDVVAEEDGQARVVGMERYDKPGAFRIAVRGDYEAVKLVVYVDKDSDGPNSGDLRVEYSGNPISIVDTEAVEGLVVDLAEAETQDGTPKDADAPTDPGGEGEGEGDPEASEAAAAGEGEAPEAGAAEPTEAEAAEPETDGAPEEATEEATEAPETE